ncbi:MAG: hypothetical protein DRR04_00570 [Gammaproteobacteria bacterium]|nr:MAG: hypothetical protein DRQ97_01045 [Gammaproteobacteria bacterium]RLA62350.1 MAG: hypothetical protein DRR04_00570 [Gammaproteobacteria bacterium]
MGKERPLNKDPEKEYLYQAMNAALAAMAEAQVKLLDRQRIAASGLRLEEAERERELDRHEDLCWRTIKNQHKPFQYTEYLGDIALPMDVVATLLRAVYKFEILDNIAKNTAKNRDELWQVLRDARDAFDDPGILGRAHQNQAAMNVLGMTERKGNQPELWLDEYQHLIRPRITDDRPFVPMGKEFAVNYLARKYKKGKKSNRNIMFDALAKEITRQRKEGISIPSILPQREP